MPTPPAPLPGAREKDTSWITLPLPELTLGTSRPAEGAARSQPLRPSMGTMAADADLPTIEAHCRLKAEGIRWAATRRRRMDEGAEFRIEIAPRDREILDRARDLGCYLWMCTPDFTVPAEPALLEEVAGCFEVLADALAMVRGMLPEVEANREFFEPALDLLAEAQSALRVAIERIGGNSDPDQSRSFDWLRGVAAREQIYIPRHMRRDDPADPASLPEIEDRIEDLDMRFQEVQQRSKRRKSHLNRLRYHAQRIGRGMGSEHDWQKVVVASDEMVSDGSPPSSVEIREALLPILDLMPNIEELPPGFGLVLREIDRYLAARRSVPEPTTAPDEPTGEVAEAARLLEGKCVLLIGGDRRPEALDALKKALSLGDLIWIETREHQSIDTFEPYIARPEVAVVILAIRWSSHSFGEVKRFCDRYDKPLVRLPAGYNPNQVAVQILAQCSGQLKGGRDG